MIDQIIIQSPKFSYGQKYKQFTSTEVATKTGIFPSLEIQQSFASFSLSNFCSCCFSPMELNFGHPLVLEQMNNFQEGTISV